SRGIRPRCAWPGLRRGVEAHDEAGARTGVLVQPDAPAVGHADLAADRQAQAGTIAAGAATPEALEQVRAVGHGHARAFIAHREAAGAELHPHHAAGWGVVHRV